MRMTGSSCLHRRRLECSLSVPLPRPHVRRVASHALQPRQQQQQQQQAPARRVLAVPQSHTDPLAASIVASVDPVDTPAPAHPFSKQELLDVAATVVKLYFAGVAKGPQAVEQELASILAADVVIKADRVKRFHDTQGLHEVLAELERAHLEYHRSEHRPMLYAASPEVQRAYALVEGTYQDVGALPGHPATFRISKVHHILSMEVKDGRVAVLWLYRQLTEEDKDELLHEPLACYPTPFPRDSLLLADAAQHASESSKMADTVRAWWQAWVTRRPAAHSSTNGNNHSSRADSSSEAGSSSSSSSSSTPSSLRRTRGSQEPGAAAPQLLAPDFRMLDAYGLYPNMRAQGRRYLNKDAALRFMQGLSYSFDLELTVLDVAVAEGSLACFSHWQAQLVPRWQQAGSSGSTSTESSDAAADAGLPAGSSSTPSSSSSGSAGSTAQGLQPQQQQEADGSMLVDGMAVDLFNGNMQLKVIWVFRGPVTAQEKHLFLQYDRAALAEAAALAESEQEAIRAARRAQREQQLSELLAWMNNYQQQWSGYVSHVQKQIARQQRLAKQQLMRQLQESSELEASLEEEELQLQHTEFGQQLQEQLAQAQQQLLNLHGQAQQRLQSFQQGQAGDNSGGGDKKQ